MAQGTKRGRQENNLADKCKLMRPKALRVADKWKSIAVKGTEKPVFEKGSPTEMGRAKENPRETIPKSVHGYP